MKSIQDLSIRNKLLLLGLTPMIALFYFIGSSMKDQLDKRNTVIAVRREVLEAEALSGVIHQLQQERGYTAIFILTKGESQRSELFAQREETDRAIGKLAGLSSAANKAAARSLGSRVGALRSAANSPAVSVDSLQRQFAALLTAVIDDVNRTALFSKNPQVKSLLSAHVSLISGKEYFGQLRNELMQTLISGKFQNNGFAVFASLKGQYDLSLAAFKRNTSENLAAFYHKQMESADNFRMKKIIDAAYADPALNRFPYTSDETWTYGVALLNSLKQIEDRSTEEIRGVADEQLAEITADVIKSIVIAGVLLMVIVALLYFIIRGMVSSVLQIKKAADRIVMGDLDSTVTVSSKDEIGSLAASFNQLITVSSEYAHIAESIGGGDYSTDVKVRSSVDTLGLSLRDMKDNLQRLSRENESRTWLLTGSGELNDQIRGEKEIKELAQQVIAKLTTYIQGQIGAIYLAENGQLILAGSYAFHHRKESLNVILPGQGLVGQSALEKKPIIFSEVPEDYVRINSALGSASPKNIIVFPFLYEDQVTGVIEIGSAREFSELQIEFLNIVAESIGIAFHSSQSRSLLKELLEETQRQTEELEAQQEELRQINEELQEKTGLLESSEAELKAQQEELQQTNEELEEKANLLEEQKEALEVAKMEVETKARELENTSRYKSEFLANMSHELRTPLNSILILAQLLAENKSKALAEKEVGFARNIYSSGTDLLTLINEILDLSKVESGKIELEIGPVSLQEISENLQSLFRELAKAKSTTFEIEISREALRRQFNTDQQRLEQILRNLLSNAFKFTGKGGKVAVRVAAMKGTEIPFSNRMKQFDQVFSFSVSDTGIGIPQEKQGLIFEAFQQADGSTKRKYGGTGLGLSISRELARALGGEIHLQSEQGKGSTFTLLLPPVFDEMHVETVEREVEVKKTLPAPVKRQLLQKGSADQDAGDDRFTIRENDKVILIIEDDASFACILLDFIRSRGYKGIVASQGNAGLSLARYYRPDAIILDMKLPVMDGAQVLRHLKNDPDLRHIPVQVISGYDRRKEGFELGAFDFVKKPLNQTGLDSAFGRIEDFISKKLKKLLVVEDNPQQNLAIRELIGNGDVKSIPAYTGEEAHRMMLNEKFDCVIIDLGLPDMGGIDLMERLKADDRLKWIPVIVYTGKDLSKQETLRLNKLANTVVLKTADSNERLLDETTLFLHRVESNLPKEKQEIIRKLHRTDEVLKDRTVLIVDDDMRNIYSLTNALEEEGVRCITAENGRAAIQILKEQPDTDIILMDVMMPEMDGYEATGEIRRMERFEKLPIIALTAKAMKGDREKCLEAGMSDYIAKPVDMERLLSLMRVWLYR